MKCQKVVLIIMSFLIVMNFSACSKQDKKQNFDRQIDPVGTIGDLDIKIPEFTFYLKCVKSDMEKEAGLKSTDKDSIRTFWKLKINNVDPVDKAQKKALETIEEIKLLLIRAKEDKIQLEQSDLDKVKSHMENIIKNEGGGDKAEAEKNVQEKYGVSLSEYESIYNDYILAYDKYSSRLLSKIKISDDDVKKQYENNIDTYNKVTVKHILLLTKETADATPSPEKVAQTQKLAEKILNEAKNGTEFESLVKWYSEDPETKDKGGEYTFKKGEMLKEFEDWSFNAKAGDMGIIESQYGYHVMKFIKKITFEDQKSDIKHELQLNELKKDLQKWKTDKKIELKIYQDVFDSIQIL